MCPSCHGLGLSYEYDLSKVIAPELSIAEDCCKIASSYQTVRYGNIYDNLAKLFRFNIQTPWKQLSEKAKNAFLYGIEAKWTKMHFVHPEKRNSWTEYVQWRGVLHEAKERYQAAQSDVYRKKMQEYLQETVCSNCKGARIKAYPAAARLQGKRISDITALSVQEALHFFEGLKLPAQKMKIAEEILKEIKERLFFLSQVGLHYLSLDRTSPTLSGGEGQRVRLASQIGSGLIGSTYILDEPSIGLHPRDNHKLLQTLIQLKSKGNTVIVVEHDEETICSADTIVDIGPLAGKNGGRLVAQGPLKKILEEKESLTGGYLSGRLTIPIPKKRRKPSSKAIRIEKASHHNLKNVSVSLPLEVFIAVTGVSGSGKSSLIIDTLYPALSNALHQSSLPIGPHKKIEGQNIDKIIAIDQTPIGRTPRSNPATYIKLFDEVRDLFSQLPESQAFGFDAGRFSFNVKEGSCPFCMGMGMTRIDMDFLEDEWVVCSHCHGKRFDEKTLSVHFKGKSIHDVLEMTIGEACEFFANFPKIKSKLDLLMKVGLDYITLGQPSPTLSGGEAQRIKLAKELSRPSTGKTLYILDEPTTGLHFHDIKKLIEVLHSLVDKGNTVLVIEHNMDLVKTADWIIDLGPEAGKEGGEIIGEGPPEKIAKLKTPTGAALKHSLSHTLFSAPASKKAASPVVDSLIVRGASQNNLKHIDTEVPLAKITVCTGPSGSGKSSFAFETLYAEGQRRYIESMSHYARQFVKQMPKPKVDSLEGLSASIAIEQKNHAGNPRSTIGTMTEIYDYLRILYAHLGVPFCPETGEEIRAIGKEYVVKKALAFPLKTKLFVLSPVSFLKQETFESFKERAVKQGFLRIRLNGAYYELDDEVPFDRKQKNELFLVVDRLILQEESGKRLDEAVEQATTLSKGSVVLATEEKDFPFNLAFTVESTGKSYPPITPHTFSFNTEQGMCQDCQGLGFQYGTDLSKFKDILEMSPLDLLFSLWKENASSRSIKILSDALKQLDIDPDTTLSNLSSEQMHHFFHGLPEEKDTSKKKAFFKWKGLNHVFIQYCKTSTGNIRSLLTTLMDQSECRSCEGSRLNPLARNVKIEGMSISDLCKRPIEEICHFISERNISKDKEFFLEEPLRQIKERLGFLMKTGLGYLALDRSAPTLSGGETQRIRLSRQLGSGLTGCLYVLDEPSIGLHPHDNDLLNKALISLRDLGNTLVLVEHDPLTIQIADHVIDFGPGAGRHGGQIMAQGTLGQIEKNPKSLTGAYLSGRKKIPIPPRRRQSNRFLSIHQASLHNLKNFSASIPVGAITCITGVSGSGKSTLLIDILQPYLEKALSKRNHKDKQLFASSLFSGIEFFDKCISLDQNPIGHTIRADVSTYVDLLTPLRYLYASLPEAKMRGLQPKHFSFNHKKGMCNACWGLGTKNIALQFLPSVKVTCDSCRGFRLNPLSLQVPFKGKHLGEVFKMPVEEARSFFDSIPKVVKILDALISVGLGYLALGQEIATLSGGETQRLRLSRELAKRSTGKTLYLFDEPSIGLHSEDISKLVSILHSLADRGNTVVLIEHNLDLIANCDYVLDLGPGPGPKGGKLIASGTPEEVALSKTSLTAKYLKDHLDFIKK
jgi:excinuclease ABC subunit A